MMVERRLHLNVVAARFGVHVETVRRWIKAGRLRAERTLGGHYRIPESALSEFENKTSTNLYKPQHR